jgi:hypothetical protein
MASSFKTDLMIGRFQQFFVTKNLNKLNEINHNFLVEYVLLHFKIHTTT